MVDYYSQSGCSDYFLNVYLEQSWAFSALGGIIISVLMFYSQSKTIYIVKDNGVLEINRDGEQNMCRRNP